MSLSYFSRKLYYGEETSYGTAAEVDRVLGIASSFNAGGEVSIEDIRAGERTYFKRVVHGLDFSPSIEFRPLTGEFLKYVFGKVTNSGSAAPYTHTIEVGNNLPSLTVEAARIGASSLAERAVGLLVQGCDIGFEPDGVVTVSWDTVAKNVSKVEPYTDPVITIPSKEPFKYTDTKLTIGSTVYAEVSSGTITISNGLQPLPRASDGTLMGFALAECEYEASFDLFFKDSSLMADFLNKTRRTVTVEFIRDPANDYIKFTFGNAVIAWEGEIPFDASELMQTVTIYPETVTVEVKDDIASY